MDLPWFLMNLSLLKRLGAFAQNVAIALEGASLEPWVHKAPIST